MSERAPKPTIDILEPEHQATLADEQLDQEALVSEEQAPVDEPSQTEEIENLPDAEVRFTDTELLGRHYPVRHMVHAAGNQRIKAIESVQATFANLRDTPHKYRLKLSSTIAEMRHGRQQRKLDEVSHLPDSSLLKQRRIKKLEKAESRKNRANLAYESHTTRMKNRVETVGTNAETRRQEYVSELVSRRDQALARKAMRQELREQGASRREVKEIINEIPKTHMDRVGRLATVAAHTDRQARRSEKFTDKTEKAKMKIDKQLSDSREHARVYAQEARQAQTAIEALQTQHIPDAHTQLSSQQNTLAGLQQQLERAHDSGSADSELIARFEQKITEVQASITESQEQLATYEERLLPYWQSVAERSRQLVVEQQQKTTSLEEALRTAKARNARADEAASRRRSTARKDAVARHHAAQDILNSKQ